MILVTHHTEEIPPGMTHAALMSGSTCGEGGTCRRSPDWRSTFGVLRVKVEVDTVDGRWFARSSS